MAGGGEHGDGEERLYGSHGSRHGGLYSGAYPPPAYGSGAPPPTYEGGAAAAAYPPPYGMYPPPPPPAIPAQDRAYGVPSQHYPPPPPADRDHHHHHPHHDHHHHHQPENAFPARHPLPNGQLVKVFCSANPDFSLSVRSGGVVLVPANHSDETQHWIRDMSWSVSVKDSTGHPAFSLVNKATGKALKHAAGELQQVLLADYVPGAMDETLLWSESEDMGKGFRTIRMANNVKLNLDAFHGDRKSGGIKDGTPAILFPWKKQENQLWKIVPVCKLITLSLAARSELHSLQERKSDLISLCICPSSNLSRQSFHGVRLRELSWIKQASNLSMKCDRVKTR